MHHFTLLYINWHDRNRSAMIIRILFSGIGALMQSKRPNYPNMHWEACHTQCVFTVDRDNYVEADNYLNNNNNNNNNNFINRF